MKRINTQRTSLIIVTILSLILVSGNALALNWTYSYDATNDASGGKQYEIYRMGYAIDADYLYFNMLTGVHQEGNAYENAVVNAGDLMINVGGSPQNGYIGTGIDAAYASGRVFGLALTNHEGDMNNDLARYDWAKSGVNDNAYEWSAVTQGHLYGDAFFSTGTYEDYADRQAAGGEDPFGGKNNAPVHITSFEEDFGSQGDVTWMALANGVALNETGTVKTTNSRKAYEVNAVVSLDSLGIVGGESFELWWSMECGNDIEMIGGTMPDRPVATPEPGTLLLLGLGLFGIIGVAKKRMA